MTAPQRPRLFVDQEVDARFAAEGYAVVPVFDPAQLTPLWEEHQRIVGDEDGITFDTIRPDRSPLRHTTAAADELWAGVLDDLFVDHQVVFSAFVVKHPGDRSGMAPHDDRSFVDDRSSRSATAWIPLVDTGPDEDNGWIGVVPRSHRTAPGLGGTGIAEWFVPYREVLAEHLVPVPARAGEAVIWDSRVIHGSPPNRSMADRPALVVALAPRGAPLVHVRGTSRRGRRIYRVDREFHLEHSPLAVARQMPDYPVLDEVIDPDPFVSPEAIAALCGLAVPPVPLVDRPADDWYGDGSGSSMRPHPVQDPRAADATRALEALTEQLAPALESVPTGRRDGLPTAPVASVDLGAPSPSPTARELFGAAVEPLAEVLSSTRIERLELRLIAGGQAVAHEAGDGPTVHLPLTMPTAAAGLAWAEAALPFELGLAVVPPPGVPVQAWNAGADDVAVLVAHLAAPAQESEPASGASGRFSWLRSRRRGGSPAATSPPPASAG